MSIPLPIVLEGAIVGLNYGLLALGFVLVYKTNRVLNFAQGELGIVAAIFLIKCNLDFGFNYWLSLTLAIILGAALSGLSELILRRLFKWSRVLVMVATIGLAQLLVYFSGSPLILTSHLNSQFPIPFHLSFSIGSTVFPPGEVLTLIVAPIVALCLAAFVRFSSWGLSMRAMSENIDSARLSGIWVKRTSTITWILAGALSAFTAILAAPGQAGQISALFQSINPDLLVFALTAALIGAMTSLAVAFVAGIGVGIVYEVLRWNISSTASVETIMFAILIAVLLIRIAALRKGARSEERSSWLQGASSLKLLVTDQRRSVGRVGMFVTLAIAALLPLVLNVGDQYLFSLVCIFGVIALSQTVLTGWAGQVSLGQFALVAVGTIMAARLGASVPLILLLPFAGVVTAGVAVIVGLPALRVRGLYLAVSTLAFALWMQDGVLATPCWKVPLIGKRVCTGLPDPVSTYIARSSFFGINLDSTRAFAWFSLIILVISIGLVILWRDRGVARRLIAVRDNELGAAGMGIPIMRTKLLAFALSGFMAGYAGVLFGMAVQQINTQSFKVQSSILVVSMAVIGGLGSVAGAVIGAVYLEGLKVFFATTGTIQYLTGGVGLLLVLLYLPSGLSVLMHKFGDVVHQGFKTFLKGGGSESSGDPMGAEVISEGPSDPVASIGQGLTSPATTNLATAGALVRRGNES